MMFRRTVQAKQCMRSLLPYHENERQWSVNSFWSCILGEQGIIQIFKLITELSTALICRSTTYTMKNMDSKIVDIANCTKCKSVYWMLIKLFWYDTIIKQQNEEHYMNLQMDQLDNPRTTRPIRMGWEMCIEPYLNWRFGCIDYPKFPFWSRFGLHLHIDAKPRSWTVATTTLDNVAHPHTPT